jgi:SCY1-like protein 1
LIGAFIRGTRDPFPPARSASVLALAATQQYFLLKEVANRILPSLCPLTTDSDKGVRDNAFRTIRGFVSKLEKVSEDPGLQESMGKYYTCIMYLRKKKNNLSKKIL